jgi:dTDP-4-amino-4,6-dideoxygalactose transaminase
MIIPRRKPYFPPNFIKSLIAYYLRDDKELEIKKLADELSHTLGVKNPILISSGRIGLYLILKASKLKKGTEVIIPGYTFGMLTNFIKKAGYIPVACDIDPHTFQMDPGDIKNKINKNTSAILATHIFGEPCDIRQIKRIADKYKLLLIEDCAESLGAKVGNTLTGHFGQVALSSFNVAKPLHGFAGGLIYGQNKSLINKIQKELDKMPEGVDATLNDVKRGLTGTLLSQTIFWPLLMYFFSFDILRNKFVSSYRAADNKKIVSPKLPPHLAYLVRLNLKEFPARIKKRLLIRKMYMKQLKNIVSLQKSLQSSTGNGYMVVGTIKKNPMLLRRFLALKGIDIAIMEEIADDCVKVEGSRVGEIYKKAIALPIYEDLTLKQIKTIASYLRSFLSDKN